MELPLQGATCADLRFHVCTETCTRRRGLASSIFLVHPRIRPEIYIVHVYASEHAAPFPARAGWRSGGEHFGIPSLSYLLQQFPPPLPPNHMSPNCPQPPLPGNPLTEETWGKGVKRERGGLCSSRSSHSTGIFGEVTKILVLDLSSWDLCLFTCKVGAG